MHRAEKKPVAAQEILLPALLLCSSLATGEPAHTAALADQPALDESGCGAQGTLRAALYGGMETSVDWSSGDMTCESMQRPHGEGIRLRFTGEVAGERLAIIIAIPDMRAGETATELPSNVTAIIEGRGRFFSTPDLNSCWTDVSSSTPVSGAHSAYAISGTLYCVAPLGEVNGEAAVSIPELSFNTIAGWTST